MTIALTAVLFLVFNITATLFIAYFFSMLALAMFCLANLFMLRREKIFPLFVAFPKLIWIYFTSQLSVSVVFLIRENFIIGDAFPVSIFVVFHIVLLAFFVVLLILLRSATTIITQRDEEIKQKVASLQLMRLDVESVLNKHPEHAKPLKQVIDALKYSDPMSNPVLAVYEEQIQKDILSMNGGGDVDIPQTCDMLLKQIAERNSRVKVMK
jgi:hypothetical protein